jgi:hypothetical protein
MEKLREYREVRTGKDDRMAKLIGTIVCVVRGAAVVGVPALAGLSRDSKFVVAWSSDQSCGVVF